MSFPITLTPSSPAGLDSPRLGDDEIRNLKSLLADLFTLPVSPSTISATIGSVSTGGKLTITNGAWTGDVVGLAYGGTAANLTASVGGIAYSGASALAILAGTATAGQIVRSGASAAPTWSTATYPATAGTSGNILTSDGTNWSSASTAFSRGGTVVNASGVSTQNIIVWQAPFACTVMNVAGYRVGGTGATINARLNGASTHLSSDLSLTSADTWINGGAVQNTAYATNDKLEIMVVSAAGTPTQIAIQVKFTRP